VALLSGISGSHPPVTATISHAAAPTFGLALWVSSNHTRRTFMTVLPFADDRLHHNPGSAVLP